MFVSKDDFANAYRGKFIETHSKSLDEGTSWEKYQALVLLIKNRISGYWA